MRILVVDDEPAVRGVIGSTLVRSGAEVQVAATVAEAVERLGNGGYDWLVVDYRLPDGTGLDVLRAAADREPKIRAVMVTGEAEVDGFREEALKLGAERVLGKPFCLHELLGVIPLAPRPPLR